MSTLQKTLAVLKLTAVACLALALLAGCGGGTITFGPNPAPGTQESPMPDAGRIWAGWAQNPFTIATFAIRGQAGAVLPNAQVVYRDAGGVTTTGPAGSNGSFEIVNMPGAFNTAPGTTLFISQIAPGMTESAPVTIIIAAP